VPQGELNNDAFGKDCVHISGLEVEGRHPRALMESALTHLKQVIGLKCGPAPRDGRTLSRSHRFAITMSSLQSAERILCELRDSPAIDSPRLNSAQMMRAFFLATATQAFAVPFVRRFSVTHTLRRSSLPGAQ
jgi:hypothetical protein